MPGPTPRTKLLLECLCIIWGALVTGLLGILPNWSNRLTQVPFLIRMITCGSKWFFALMSQRIGSPQLAITLYKPLPKVTYPCVRQAQVNGGFDKLISGLGDSDIKVILDGPVFQGNDGSRCISTVTRVGQRRVCVLRTPAFHFSEPRRSTWYL